MNVLREGMVIGEGGVSQLRGSLCYIPGCSSVCGTANGEPSRDRGMEAVVTGLVSSGVILVVWYEEMSGCHGYRSPLPGLAKCLLWSLGLGAGFSVSLLLRSHSDPSALDFKHAYFGGLVWHLCVLEYLKSPWCSYPLAHPFFWRTGKKWMK